MNLHIKHLLELNDVFIAFLRVSTLDPRLYVADYAHELALKRTPYKTMVHGMAYVLVPDGVVDIHVKRDSQPDLRLPVLLEHDRGWERGRQFKQKMKAQAKAKGASGPAKAKAKSKAATKR